MVNLIHSLPTGIEYKHPQLSRRKVDQIYFSSTSHSPLRSWQFIQIITGSRRNFWIQFGRHRDIGKIPAKR